MHTLNLLLAGCTAAEIIGPTDRDVRALQFNSRAVQCGDAFFAVPGTQVDGHRYINDAVAAGATAIICERLPDRLSPAVTYVRVESASAALGTIASAFYSHPSRQLTLIGITGTNGKTTSATLLYRLFRLAGYKCGLLSTIQNFVLDKTIDSTHTTGDALQINHLLAEMVKAGCTYCFMEVTSHAIDQHRVTGLAFDGGLFTNLSHDHLDYHKTIENYRDTKKRFFDSLPPGAFALTNADDPSGSYMVSSTLAQVVTFGCALGVDFLLSIQRSEPNGLEITVNDVSIRSQLVGKFNAYNVCAVYAVAKLLLQDDARLIDWIGSLDPVPGRMQRIDAHHSIHGIVDFAHTPEALRSVLTSLRSFLNTGQRIITVIGCGGDRDKEKRPIMASIAAELGDLVVLTSDNPRSEDPAVIIQQMCEGIKDSKKPKTYVEINRRLAIQFAAEMARPGDIILIAGKGHEQYQEIGSDCFPFDDAKELQEAMVQMASAPNDSSSKSE